MKSCMCLNNIMLCRRLGEATRVVMSGLKYVWWMALTATVVVFPVCLAMQATMRFDVSFSRRCWYGKGLKLSRCSAKSVGLFLSCVSAFCIGF